MCYNIAARQRTEELGKKYGIKPDVELDAHKYYHVSGYTHPMLPVLVWRSGKRFELMYWGFIPSWTKGEEKAKEFSNMTLNAKAETIFEKPMYMKSIAKNRCILPVDGYYQWKDVGKMKYPHYIFPKDKGIFSLGCIYDTWISEATGEVVNSFSIITTEANEVMAMINSGKRMPLILDDEGWQRWINPKSTKKEIQSLLKPSPNEILSYHTISHTISHPNMNTNYPDIQNKVLYYWNK
jgi:putative SOS response-associated peptidase YedK